MSEKVKKTWSRLSIPNLLKRFLSIFSLLLVFSTQFSTSQRRSAHMALGARLALRRPPQNRLKIGVRRKGAVPDNLLETASNSHGRLRSGVDLFARVAGAYCWVRMLPLGKLGFIKVLGLYIFCEKLAKQLRNKWATRKVLVKGSWVTQYCTTVFLSGAVDIFAGCSLSNLQQIRCWDVTQSVVTTTETWKLWNIFRYAN